MTTSHLRSLCLAATPSDGHVNRHMQVSVPLEMLTEVLDRLASAEGECERHRAAWGDNAEVSYADGCSIVNLLHQQLDAAHSEVTELKKRLFAANEALWSIANATGAPEQRVDACQAAARKAVGWEPF